MNIRVKDLKRALNELPNPEFDGQILKVPVPGDFSYSIKDNKDAMLNIITIEAVQYRENNSRWLEWEIIL